MDPARLPPRLRRILTVTLVCLIYFLLLLSEGDVQAPFVYAGF